MMNPPATTLTFLKRYEAWRPRATAEAFDAAAANAAAADTAATTKVKPDNRPKSPHAERMRHDFPITT
jgi:hypothetical protein